MYYGSKNIKGFKLIPSKKGHCSITSMKRMTLTQREEWSDSREKAASILFFRNLVAGKKAWQKVTFSPLQNGENHVMNKANRMITKSHKIGNKIQRIYDKETHFGWRLRQSVGIGWNHNMYQKK